MRAALPATGVSLYHNSRGRRP